MEQEGILDQQKDSLTQLAEAFRSWRAERKVGAKIPEQLWDQACKLEPEYGFGAMSHACRLNYEQFRRRLGLPVPGRRAHKAAGNGYHRCYGADRRGKNCPLLHRSTACRREPPGTA